MVYMLWWSFCIHSGEVFFDCWLWNTHTCLLQSVVDLSSCCEEVFLHQGKNSSLFHHSCFPWSSRSFGVAELTSAIFFFNNVPNSWFGHTWCLNYFSDGFVLIVQPSDASLTVTAPWISYWEGTATDSKCKCLTDEDITREQLLGQVSRYFWSPKKWEAHIETVVFPTLFTWFGCKYPQTKADSLQWGIKWWIGENCVYVPIFMDLTVLSMCVDSAQHVFMSVCASLTTGLSKICHMSGWSLDVLKLDDATRRPNSSRLDTNMKTPCEHTEELHHWCEVSRNRDVLRHAQGKMFRDRAAVISQQ